MTTKLSVNINKVATLRNTRHLDLPSLAQFTTIALRAGAHGITIHPRPDQRHIRTADVPQIAEVLKSYPHAEFNIEGNPFFPEYMDHIRAVRPTQCTLVPDGVDSFTSNQGFTLNADTCKRLTPLISEMKSLGSRVSLFMDADSPDLEAAKEIGADRIELYTEPYAAGYAVGGKERDAILRLFATAATRAKTIGLDVNAGHDLNLQNLPALVAAIPFLAEVSIGHALIADALQFGLAHAIHLYLQACKPAAQV